MPGRVDVRAGMSYDRYLFERGSFASGGEKILLLRLEGSFDPIESPALVRKIADARFPGLVRPIGDDADAEAYHPRKKEKLFVSELFWSVSSAPIFVLLSQKKLATP